METSSWKMAISATSHCLMGCAIGEVIGTVIGSGFGWSNLATEMLTIPLAFLFGYGFTVQALLRHNVPPKQAVRLSLAADSMSILSMEIVDTFIILLIPGALAAGPSTALFWSSLAIALAAAFVMTVPVNRWLIARGKGHAVMHSHHH